MDLKQKPSALVLLSGGMDSTTLLYYVKKTLLYTKVETIGFDYSQRHKIELEYAKKIAKKVKVPFRIIKIDLRQFGGSPLTSETEVPRMKDDKQHLTVVPARNSIFLSLATAYAEVKGLQDIFIGATIDDFKSYPDCRSQFISLISKALSAGNNIRGVYAPFANLSKFDVVSKGKVLQVPYVLTYSCYEGLAKPCNQCDACVERNKVLQKIYDE